MLLFGYVFAYTQDSTNVHPHTKINIEFWEKWQLHQVFGEVRIPSALHSYRDGLNVPGVPDTVTDNPLLHGAIYVALHTTSDIKNKLFLFADLYAEHRGISYGVFNRNNVVVFPVLRLEAKDSFKVFNERLHLHAKLGTALNEKLDEGLMIYNIDVQGFQLISSLRQWKFRFTCYGDLYNGIGLDIDDLYAASLEKQFSEPNVHAGVSFVSARPPYYPLRNNYSVNLFARRTFKGVSVYVQLGHRPFRSRADFYQPSFTEKSAFVIGADLDKKTHRFELHLKPELRYYGNAYNFNHYNYLGPRYRKPAADIYENYGNTVGAFLYPLRKFDTPFSQWAVFTELSGFNISMLSVSGTTGFLISEKFEVYLNPDINFMLGSLDPDWDNPGSKRSLRFVYPFFDAGIGYKMLPGVEFKAGLTNKAMNLDLSYPSHYLLKQPCLQFSAHANF